MLDYGAWDVGSSPTAFLSPNMQQQYPSTYAQMECRGRWDAGCACWCTLVYTVLGAAGLQLGGIGTGLGMTHPCGPDRTLLLLLLHDTQGLVDLDYLANTCGVPRGPTERDLAHQQKEGGLKTFPRPQLWGLASESWRPLIWLPCCWHTLRHVIS